MFRGMSIQLKILSLIIITLIITVAIVLTITIKNQSDNLIAANNRNLANNTEMLNNVIKNIMLSGEAPVAVGTMQDLKAMNAFTELSIYRTDGSNAFNDYSTLNYVNKVQMDIMFEKTERLERSMLANEHFNIVLESHTAFQAPINELMEMEYFFPILNMPDCWSCHSDDHSIRGVAHFKISIADVYERIRATTIYLTAIFGAIGLLLAIILIIFIHRIIILPILTIGAVVNRVGDGDFEKRVNINNRDELGTLADEINGMTQGLKERFELSRYVSRSTDELVRSGSEAGEQSRRRHLTVLFSDIRGFTSYSDRNEPHEVIKNLNTILQAQANIIARYNGDIDKFVGDEIMATFESELDALKCAYTMIKEVYRINKKNKTDLFVGIGINTGEVVAGNIGSEERVEYAIIGDTVNLAARLCSIAKKNMLLISEDTFIKVAEKVDAKAVLNQHIKGKAEPVTFYIVENIHV